MLSRRLAAALAALCVAAVPGAAYAAPGAGPESAQKLIVKFRDRAPASERAAALDAAGAKGARPLLLADTVALEAGNRSVLARHGAVEYVEPDALAYATGVPNDPSFPSQYGLNNTGQTGGTPDADIDGVEATDAATGAGQTIGILDTGVDQDHEDLASKIVCNFNETTSPTVDDLFGHGTHVAGIAAAVTGNSVGVAGAAPAAGICNIKVLSDDGSGQYSWIANGITRAVDNGIKVVNLSLGGSTNSRTLQRAVDNAWKRGVVLVAAAGNSGTTAKSYPAAYANVIAVGATDHNDAKAWFSNYGASWVDVAAPGVNIYATLPNHPNTIGQTNYGSLNGTSMATPFTAGAAALVWSSPFGTGNAAVRSQLEGTADKTAGTGSDWEHGRVNAAAAVTVAVASDAGSKGGKPVR